MPEIAQPPADLPILPGRFASALFLAMSPLATDYDVATGDCMPAQATPVVSFTINYRGYIATRADTMPAHGVMVFMACLDTAYQM